MNITIPVSIFSKKIITKAFGTKSPIVVEAGTPFYANLFLRSRGNAAITHALELELSQEVVFDLPENPLFSTHAIRLRIGDYINSYHRRELNNYIRKRAATGCPNITAVQEFCQAHDITLEEDITFDAIIRDYRRKKSEHFHEKKPDFLETKTKRRGRLIRNNLNTQIPDFSFLTDAELDAIIEKYYTDNQTLFLKKRDKAELKLLKRKLIAFVYRRCAHRPLDQCLKKLKLSKAQRVTIWKYAQSFQDYLPSLPPLAV